MGTTKQTLRQLRNHKNMIALILLLSIGFLLRTINLAHLPDGFFADEASVGYNAYAIIHTGKDEHGKLLPFFFEAFGEYKNPIAIYSAVLPVFLFGLHEWSVRLVSVAYGTLSILGSYLLCKQLLKKEHDRESYALLAAFFFTITPWSIHLSRVVLEGIMSYVCFTLFAVYFFLRTKENMRYFFPLSILFFSLAFYSYFPARLFIPFLFSLLIILYHKTLFQRHNLKTYIISGILLLVCGIPILKSMENNTLLSRWQQVSIFAKQETIQETASHISINYLSHFSLDFLFLKGDSGMIGQAITRHSVRGFGEFFLFQLPLILAGIFFLIKKERKVFFLLLFWILLYPLGSMFTTDPTAQATRSVIGIIPFTILSAVGMLYLIKQSHLLGGFLGKITTVFLFAIIISCNILYLKIYFTEYNLYASDFWGWQYGPRDTMHYFLSNKDNYDDLYMSGEFNGSYIFLRFYDPENRCQYKCKLGDFMSDKSLYQPMKRQLFALSPDYLKKSLFQNRFKTLKIIYYPNHTIAFKIGVIVQ